MYNNYRAHVVYSAARWIHNVHTHIIFVYIKHKMHICIYAGRLACNIFGVKPLKSIIYALFDGSGKLKTFFAPSECTTHTHIHTFRYIYYAARVLVYTEPSSARSHHRQGLYYYMYYIHTHSWILICVYIYIYRDGYDDDGIEHLLRRYRYKEVKLYATYDVMYIYI